MSKHRKHITTEVINLADYVHEHGAPPVSLLADYSGVKVLTLKPRDKRGSEFQVGDIVRAKRFSSHHPGWPIKRIQACCNGKLRVLEFEGIDELIPDYDCVLVKKAKRGG